MTNPIYYDTETCGLHGVPVIIQWCVGETGETNIHSFWTEPIGESLELIEMLMAHPDGVIAFNIAFDHFHLTKIYNMFELYLKRGGKRADYPIDHINEIAMLEADARDGFALKPAKALDLMLCARKGAYQSTMDRKDIIIRKIPAQLAPELASELNKRIPMKDIYFSRSAKGEKWHVLDVKGDKGGDFKNVVLKFAPSAALKVLMQDILGEVTTKYGEIEIDRKYYPREHGYAPFATAGLYNKDTKKVMPVGLQKDGTINWRWTWPRVLENHVSHWAYNEKAREYARNDVKYLKILWNHLGRPEMGDDDSELACLVATTRWKGFAADIPELLRLKEIAQSKQKMALAPHVAKRYLGEVLSEMEKLVLVDTKKVTLKEIASWSDHPAAKRAQDILDGRAAKKEIELYDKIIQAGRFHASFKVIGTLSSRMAGSDGLNAQGIKKAKEVRKAFTLISEEERAGSYDLEGGDFDAFEVALMEAAYGDEKLRATLLSGKKIHALFAMELFPGNTYEQIEATKGTSDDLYLKGKSGIFALGYGGTAYTLQTRLGVSAEVAERAFRSFAEKYPKIKESRQKIFDFFCTMRQPHGIGTKVEWHEPHDYIESIFGFRRYFSLENRIGKALFELAEKPPETWKKLNIRVVRRDREQTAQGAIQSALYGAAFQIQSSNMRAAGNHIIQSSGATITKNLQRALWDIQPVGCNPWMVRVMNVHDEIMGVIHKDVKIKVKETVHEVVERFRNRVPLIEMKWKDNLNNWGEK
jgi:hypothetical protein